MTLFRALLCVLTSMVMLHAAAGLASAQEPDSPRLRQLGQEIQAGTSRAADNFWAEIQRSGAPLVERKHADTNMLLVTFLWRDPGDTRNVVVYSGHTNTLFGFTTNDLARHSMRRLRGTDVWYLSYLLPADARFTYYLSPNDDLTASTQVTDWNARARTWRPDPLNPRRYRRPHEDRDWVASLVELPDAPPQPWVERGKGVPEGRLEEHRFRSALLGNERRVWVYTPASNRTDQRPAHLLIMFDGWAAVHRQPTLAILDNLHASGRIEPVVAVMIEQLDRPGELGCNRQFSQFLASELVPWLRERYSVTRVARQTIVSGGSRGGLAAACAGLHESQTFGTVFSQAGQFPWKAGDAELEEENARTDAEYGWIMREYAKRATLPVRFFLAVGRFDRTGDYPLLLANRHFRDVLLAKGYALQYWEFGGGHEDINPWLPQFLLAYFGHQERR